MTVLINVSFVLAWTPFAVLCFWTVFSTPESVPYGLSLISPLAVKTSTTFNPIIYYMTNAKLRAAIKCVLGLSDQSIEEQFALSSIRPRTHSGSSTARVSSF